LLWLNIILKNHLLGDSMGRKTKSHCKFCQHDDRESLEEQINSLAFTCDEVDKENGWASGNSSRHMRNHVSDYEDKSNPQCNLCVHPMRSEFEQALHSGDLKASSLASALDTTPQQIQKHVKSHLQPLVQKSAALMIAKKEVDEIEMLSNNIQRLDIKLDEVFQRESLDREEIDSLTKLAREVRESLKYLMEFKGKLVHRRQDTIIVAQMQVVQEVLAQGHPEVWLDVKKKMQEKLI